MFIIPNPVLVPTGQLQNRQDGLEIVVGYINGDPNAALTCPPGTWYPYQFLSKYFACCDKESTFTCLATYTTCAPYSIGDCAGNSLCTACPSLSPACVVYVEVSSAQDTTGYTSYGCGDAAAGTSYYVKVFTSSTPGVVSTTFNPEVASSTTSSHAVGTSNGATGVSSGNSPNGSVSSPASTAILSTWSTMNSTPHTSSSTPSTTSGGGDPLQHATDLSTIIGSTLGGAFGLIAIIVAVVFGMNHWKKRG